MAMGGPALCARPVRAYPGGFRPGNQASTVPNTLTTASGGRRIVMRRRRTPPTPVFRPGVSWQALVWLAWVGLPKPSACSCYVLVFFGLVAVSLLVLSLSSLSSLRCRRRRRPSFCCRCPSFRWLTPHTALLSSSPVDVLSSSVVALSSSSCVVALS